MFADNTLTPKEAVRLCALGLLALGPRTYAALATELRHFVDRLAGGPTPEIMGHSIELLKYEGLITSSGGDGAPLELTESGRQALRQLLLANVRPHPSELNKLVIALKFHFLHLLPAGEQQLQLVLLADAVDRELARLADLRDGRAGDAGYLVDWLDHDMAMLEQRRAWLRQFAERLPAAANGSGA